jgi:two-component system sensor histidine kinase BaeS
LVAAFLRRQTKGFYLIGGPILLLVAIVAFFLSEHFLSPIKQLTTGTEALTSRKFETRIDVQSKDELGQLASDFNTMAQTLKKYEKMRQQWISDISHELRTPLAILQGEIEALQDGVRAINSKALASLQSEVVQLNKIVDDLHMLTSADSRGLNIKMVPVKPLQILRRAVDLNKTRLEQKNIEVKFALDADENTVVIGDADYLTRLFLNLTENSLRYTDPPGKLKILGRTASDTLTICFEDSAPGVPQNSLRYLFDRLYRVDKSRSRELGGSGLGLSICKQIVEIHGGNILAANGALGGLAITIELPLEEKKPK